MGVTDRDFRLGPWSVKPSLLELHREGEVRGVGAKVMDLLLCLAERPGEAVSKDELIERVWAGAFTSDEALTTAVYELRKALDDEARRPRFVGTIRGRGYRLLVTPEAEPVDPEGRDEADEGVDEAADHGVDADAGADAGADEILPPDEVDRPAPRRGLRVAIGLVLVGLLGVAVFFGWPDRRGDRASEPESAEAVRTPSGPEAEPSSAPGPVEQDPRSQPAPAAEGAGGVSGAAGGSPEPSPEEISVAILPLEAIEVESAVDSVAESAVELAADALAERLAVDLSRLGGLEIVPGFSSVVDPRSGDLGTDAVVEGSVRRMGEMVAVSIRLVDRRSLRLLWGGNYEYAIGDELRMQRQLSLEIARQVRDRLAPPARTPDPKAAEAFLLGDYFLGLDTPSGRAKAVDYFTLAIDHDPGWASAHAGLAEAWIESASELPAESKAPVYDRAREAAEAALVLDADLPEAHASLGSLYFQHLWDWPRAEEHFRLGCPPDTCSTEDAPRYAAFLSAMGRHEEALAVLEGSLVHDPASKRASLAQARSLYLARRFAEAPTALERARELDPGSSAVLRLEVDILLALGRDEEAVEVLSRLPSFSERGSSGGASSGREGSEDLGELYRSLGLGAVLQRVVARSGAAGADPVWLASLEARAGRAEAALAWLQRAFEERHEGWVWVRVDPAFDGLRERPELRRLLEPLGTGSGADSGPS